MLHLSVPNFMFAIHDHDEAQYCWIAEDEHLSVPNLMFAIHDHGEAQYCWIASKRRAQNKVDVFTMPMVVDGSKILRP